MKQRDLIIIGGGSAGMAAALSAKEQGIQDILILERDHKSGGILNQCIHNGFGLQVFKEELSGPAYALRYQRMIEQENIEMKLDTHVLSVTADKQVTYVNKCEGYVTLQAKAIIFAVGCYERSAGAISLTGSRPYGIFTAGCAQKYLNLDNIMVGKRVLILGSGDIGLIMARRMSLEGAQVLAVAERMPYSNGLMRNIVQCLDDFDIPLYTSHTVIDIKGNQRLEEVTIAQLDEQFMPIKGTEKVFKVDTLLLSVGLLPECSLEKGLGLCIDPHTHGICVNEHLESDIPGIYACGNALHVHDLVDFVSMEAKRAGKHAAAYITNKPEEKTYRNTFADEGIGYVLPQRVSKNCDEMITFSMRVRKPYKKCRLQLVCDGEIVKTYPKPYLLPAEMVMVQVDGKLLKGERISFQVEEVEA